MENLKECWLYRCLDKLTVEQVAQLLYDPGSSVDLAPTLMTIYDNYATSNGTAVKECNHNTLSPETTEHATAVKVSSSSPPLSYHKGELENLAVAGASHESCRPSTTGGSDNSDGSCPSGDQAHCTVGMEPEVKEGGESDGPPSALGAASAPNGGLTMSYCDASKKRPLSISSTSSATSSTSSLPRPQRKKVAGPHWTLSGSPLVPNGHLPSGADSAASAAAARELPDGIVGGTMTLGAGAAASGRIRVSPMATTTSGASLDVSMTDPVTDDDDYSEMSVRSRAATSVGCLKNEDDDGGDDDDDDDGMSGRKDSSSSSGAVSYIDKVLAEIVATERAYVHDLRDIIEGYLYELHSDHESMLDTVDIGALFGNIEEIYDFNRAFLDKLETCQEDAVRLAQCFVDHNDGFVIYTDYCTNYPRAVEVLTAVMSEPERADVLRRQQMKLAHSLPLGAYLLKPVQRILKYHLLLQNILSHMVPRSPSTNGADGEDDSVDSGGGGGVGVVEAALSSMTNMAQHINEMKRKHEHAVRVQEITGLLYEWDGADLTTYGELVLEETFRMHGAKGDRHLVLFERGLLIAKHKEDSGLILKDSIMCSNLMLVEMIPREPLSFHVIPFDNPRGQYTFQARSLDQKRQWCLELKRLILESYTADKAIPASVKDRVLALTSRDEQKAEQLGGAAFQPPSTPKACPAPDYLERKRRPRRRSVASVLPDFAHLKSQVTKKVLTRRGDGVSPKVSPRVHRRRSDSAVPRDTIRHLREKQKKRELLCEGDDVSDTDSTEPVLYRSMESLHSTDTPVGTGRCGRSSLGDADDGGGASSCTDFQCDDESGLDTPGSTPTTSPSLLQWPGGSLTPEPTSPCRPASASGYRSPLKRTDSFRIATMLHRVDSRKPVGSCRTTERPSTGNTGGAAKSAAKESKGRTFMRSRRRVSEGDLSYMRGHADAERDVNCNLEPGYIRVLPGRVTTDNDGDDEAEEEPAYPAKPCQQPMIRLVEDDDGDYVALYEPNDDANNNNRQSNRRARTSITTAHARRADSMRPRRQPSPAPHKANRGPRKDIREPADHYDRSLAPNTDTPVLDSHSTGAGLYDNIDFYISPNNDRKRAVKTSPSDHALYKTAPLESYLASRKRAEDDRRNANERSDGRGDPWVPQQARQRGRLRSNSLSSLDGVVSEVSSKPADRRLISDKLVFSNRCPYVSSAAGCPPEVRHDPAIQRTIARLATPPRDLGPDEVVLQIHEMTERGRVIARYATPPRCLAAPAGAAAAGEAGGNSEEVLSPRGTAGAAQSRSHSTLPSDMRYAGPTFWTDLEEYIACSPSSHYSSAFPRFPVDDQGAGTSSCLYGRSVSSPGAEPASPVSPSASECMRSPTISSPSSVTSSESLVDSLKQAVFSLGSRLASHLPRSVESSPRRAPRCRSISALEELKVESLQQEQQKHAGRKKDRRGRFVAQLAKVYTEHVRRKARSPSVDSKGSFEEKETSVLSKQLNTLLREGKPGSSVIGERMASNKPVVLGPYTLPRHRPLRPKKAAAKAATEAPSSKKDTEDEDPAGRLPDQPSQEDSPDTVVRRRSQKMESESPHSSSAYDSGCLDVGVRDLTLSKVDQQPEHSLATTMAAFNKVYTAVASDDDDSSIYYYERKFVEDLESNFGDDAFRDSAVYSDDGCALTEAEVAAAAANVVASLVGCSGGNNTVSVRETMKLIEQRSRTRSVPRTEIRQEEKAKGIKDILAALEAAAESRFDAARAQPADGDAEGSERTAHKSVRDRTRELVECATLTRIRQTACQVLEDLPLSGEEGAAGASPPLRRGRRSRSRSRRW